MTAPIEQPGATIAKQPRLLEFDAGFGDPALYGVVLDHGAAERAALGSTDHHQLNEQLAEADRAHAMMDACWPKPDLRDLEAVAFRAEQILARHTHAIEG